MRWSQVLSFDPPSNPASPLNADAKASCSTSLRVLVFAVQAPREPQQARAVRADDVLEGRLVSRTEPREQIPLVRVVCRGFGQPARADRRPHRAPPGRSASRSTILDAAARKRLSHRPVHDPLDRHGAAAGSISTLSTRRPSMSTTSNRRSPQAKRSPARGTRASRVITNPASVW